MFFNYSQIGLYFFQIECLLLNSDENVTHITTNMFISFLRKCYTHNNEYVYFIPEENVTHIITNKFISFIFHSWEKCYKHNNKYIYFIPGKNVIHITT